MLNKIFLNSSFFLLCFFSINLIVSNIVFLLGFNLSFFNIVISILLSTILMIITNEKTTDVLFSIFLALFISIISYYIAITNFDTSWDGQGYHQETIYLLKNGWNPIYENSNAFRIWVNLYQKGNETIQANIYLVTNKIESGKMFNILLLYCAFFVFFSLMDTLNIKNIYKLLFSFIAVFNPVVFTQIFTYYIDGNWYLTLLISLCSLLLYFSNRRTIFILFFILSSVVFCSLKFSSVPIFIVFLIFALVYDSLYQKRILIKTYFSIFFLGIICNVHPFISNIKNGNHILHPFLGNKKIDIINQNIPEMLLGKNRIERILISLFSKTNNDIKANLSDTLKFPFIFHKDEFFINYDTRLGGFGFFFSGILVLAIVIAFYSFFKQNIIDKKKIFFIMSAIFVGVLINPASWWSRLSAQIWLIPLLFIIWGVFSKNKILIRLSQLGIVLFMVNILISGGITFLKIQQDNKIVNDFINSVGDKTVTLDLSNQFGFQQYYVKFKERKINYKIAKIKEKKHLAPFTPDVYYIIE